MLETWWTGYTLYGPLRLQFFCSRCAGVTEPIRTRVAISRDGSIQFPAAQKAEPCQRIDRRGESALGWLQNNGNRPHGAAGTLNHGAIMGSRKPYGSPLGFGLVVQTINGAQFQEL